jgi:hypothetical protein
MKFLHYEFDLDESDAVKVTLDKQANVRLLDESNFQKYRRGKDTPTSAVSPPARRCT